MTVARSAQCRRLHHPTDRFETADFVANLDPVNAIADSAPGFVWRLQDDSGNATSVRADPDPLFIINMSVWETIEALEDFVRRCARRSARRREWFQRMAEAYLVLWWVPVGELPSLEDALRDSIICAGTADTDCLHVQTPVRAGSGAGLLRRLIRSDIHRQEQEMGPRTRTGTLCSQSI